MIVILMIVFWVNWGLAQYDSVDYYEWSLSLNSFQQKSLPSVQEKATKDQIWENSGPFSQCGQDLFVLHISNHMKNGYFIELAANDYYSGSNSFYIERNYDWKGICIEPNPEYHERLLRYRTCKLYTNPVSAVIGQNISFRLEEYNSIVVATHNETVFEAHAGDVTLTSVTLESILDHAKAPNVIDYLSLDVEGHELYVVKHFNFQKYKFMVMTVERPVRHVHHILSHHGYWWIHQICDFGDVVYVHMSHPNITYLLDTYRMNANSDWENNHHDYMRIPAYKGK